MVNRQKIYIGLIVSAGVCVSVGFYIFYRRYSKKKHTPVTSTVIPNFDRNPSLEIDNDESESVHLNEIKIPDGGVPLTPDQASILTRFLYESDHDEEQLHRVLSSIANASTFKESQINLANAACIHRLRELLIKTHNDTTQCKILLALHNLALNDFAIVQFTGIVVLVIDLCRIHPVKTLVRRYGLNLLINMSVLEHLHEEYMSQINELSSLIETSFECEDEALSIGKILVNLSTNKSNLENLLKLTDVELKFIMNFCTSNRDQSSKLEHILHRYLTFYCHLADQILEQFHDGSDTNNNSSLLLNSKMHKHGSVYFEFFDPDKQILAKSLLRLQYDSSTINTQMKRLYQLMEKIRQNQIQFNTVNSL